MSRAILARLEGEARALGYRRVVLETGSRQPEAIELYRSAGYGPATPYGQWEDDEMSVFFGKDL